MTDAELFVRMYWWIFALVGWMESVMPERAQYAFCLGALAFAVAVVVLSTDFHPKKEVVER